MSDDEMSFGYSIRVSGDRKTVKLEFRFDEDCTDGMLIDALEALAEQMKSNETRLELNS